MPNPRHMHERSRRHEIGNVVGAPAEPRHSHSGPVKRKIPRHATKLEPTPVTKTMESDESYSRRIKHGTYAEEGIRRRRRRKLIAVAVIAAVAVVAALVTGAWAYFKNTDKRLVLPSPDVEKVLVEPSAGEPYYVLCTADLSDPAYSYTRPSNLACMLVRIDEAARQATLITIPSEVPIQFPDDEYYTVADYPDDFGEQGLVQAVSEFAGVPISHLVITDAERIAAMVDLVGGVEMDIASEVDDPEAGHVVIKPGTQVLGGEDALVVMRATNVAGGLDTVAAARMELTVRLVSKALDSAGIGFANVVSDASHYIDTDWTSSELLALGDACRPADSMTFYQCVVPYVKTASAKDGSAVYRYIESDWRSLMDAVGQGLDPASIEHVIGDVNTQEVTVEVRNGTQIDGAAAKLGDMLSELGYNVIGVGNVDDGTTYPETLIVYTSEQYEDAALSIVRDIGAGRVVNGGDFYSSKANVIAIIGVDWSR